MDKGKISETAICRKCQRQKPRSEFYANDLHFGGTQGRCKECARARVRENRKERADQYAVYERGRANRPHRVEARKEYVQTDAGKKAAGRATRKYRQKYPGRQHIYKMVYNAVRRGDLQKPDHCMACGCGDRVIHAHHESYDRPLDVKWLCDVCHVKWHKQVEALGECRET